MSRFFTSVLALTLILAYLDCACCLSAVNGSPIDRTNFDFSAWNTLLERYVVPGIIDGVTLNMVDYNKISQDENYMKITAQLEGANTSGFTWSQYHAFWINAYNYAAIRSVIEHPCKLDLFPGGCGPITSIRQCGVQQPSANVIIFQKRTATIAGEEISIMGIIEKLHNPPAPWVVDPRYHSALCAAAVSAPDLAVTYGYPDADLLDRQLNHSMVSWLSNPLKGGSFNIATKQLIVSQTFRWDMADWNANGKSIWWWLHQYGTPLMKDYDGTPIVSFLKFNWSLNGEVGALCLSKTRPCYPWWGLLVTILGIVLILLAFVTYWFCARALKKKAFRDYVGAEPSINDELLINGDRS